MCHSQASLFPRFGRQVRPLDKLVKEPLIYGTIGRMAALCPRSTLTYLSDKPRVSLRDALPSIPLSQEIRGSLRITTKYVLLSYQINCDIVFNIALGHLGRNATKIDFQKLFEHILLPVIKAILDFFQIHRELILRVTLDMVAHPVQVETRCKPLRKMPSKK